MTVMGVDAWRKGWVAVLLEENGKAAADCDRELAQLITRHPKCEVIGVDMPIGLPRPKATRACDPLAAEYVGPRRNSVFPAALQAVLDAASHRKATALSKAQSGKGISQQSYALRQKIGEVATIAKSDPRLIEVHPEVSFCAMAGGEHLIFAKKTWNGQAERRMLLKHEEIRLPARLDGDCGSVPVDDVLDAAAAAWSARRYAGDRAEAFPPSPKRPRPAIWR